MPGSASLPPTAVRARDERSTCCKRGARRRANAIPKRPPCSIAPAVRESTLATFLLDKAFYELDYELNNRPAWVYLPLHGLLRLLRAAEQAP